MQFVLHVLKPNRLSVMILFISKNILNLLIILNIRFSPIKWEIQFTFLKENVLFNGATRKLLKKTPSPLLTPEIRAEMGKAAVEAAKAVNYYGAGTIEFVVGEDLKYFFLEMNTRLQVEHPITERVVGIDLVKEQLKIAAGCELKYTQEELTQNGHALQCRIYAEDPDNNFMPQPGIIQHLTEPHGFGIRCDGYVHEGYEIPIYYDPMITKLIVWGHTRNESIRRMKRALYEYKITGVKNSIKFLEKILEVQSFKDGNYNTHFIEDNREALFAEPEHDERFIRYEDMSMIAAFVDYLRKIEKTATTKNAMTALATTGKILDGKEMF